MTKLDRSVPVVHHEVEDVGADDHKRDQKNHEVMAATILSNSTAQKQRDLLAEDEINAVIRGTIPMTASWTMTANSCPTK